MFWDTQTSNRSAGPRMGSSAAPDLVNRLLQAWLMLPVQGAVNVRRLQEGSWHI